MWSHHGGICAFFFCTMGVAAFFRLGSSYAFKTSTSRSMKACSTGVEAGTNAKVVLERVNKKSNIFLFYTIFHFGQFYRTCYFEFLNSVLIKNLKRDSSLC
jgi:hypothetical protein